MNQPGAKNETLTFSERAMAADAVRFPDLPEQRAYAGIHADLQAGRSDSEFKVGDPVEVIDEGLEALRRCCPGMPPNHHGRVAEVSGETITVEFPIDGSYDGHSQVAPYPKGEVRHRSV